MAGESLTQLDARYLLKLNALARPGGVIIDGDSRTQLGSGGNAATSGTSGNLSANFTHILAALLGIAPDEIVHRGASGNSACSAYRSVALNSGSGKVAYHSMPPHMQRFGQASRVGDKAAPGLHLVCYGLNDMPYDPIDFSQAQFAMNESASINGHRYMVSRGRAARLFPCDDAIFGYATGGSGAWTTPALDYCTCGKIKRYSTVGGVPVVTVTIPVVVEPTVMGIAFLANSNATGILAAGSAGVTSPTTITIGTTPNFPATGSIDVPLAGGGVQAATYSSRTNTVFTLDAAGITAMTGKVTGATGARVTRTKGLTVTFGGTATNATNAKTGLGSASATTQVLGGQGAAGTPCHIVKRFVITAADAGKTITFTASSLLLGETFDVDGAWLEDPDPPPSLVFGVPAAAYGAFNYAAAGCDNRFTSLTPFGGGFQTNVSTANTNLQNLVAEFDSQVAFVDLDAVFNSLYAARVLCATAGTNTPAASGTAAGFVITPRDATNCVINVGSQLRHGPNNSGLYEEIEVTGIDKTNGGLNDGNWAITTVRATSAEGASTIAAFSAPTGYAIFDSRAFSTDRTHWSHEGMVVVASTALTTASAMTPTTRQLAVGAGYKGQKLPRLVDAGWIGPFDPTGGTRNASATATALDTINGFRINVTERCLVTSLQMTVGGTNVATSLVQMGVFLDGPGGWGNPIIDSGDISSAVAANTVITYTLPRPFELEPGTYWIGFQCHTALGTFKGIKNAYNLYPIVITGTLPTGNYLESQAIAYLNPTTGPGAALVACPPPSVGGAVGISAATAVPYISAAIAVCPRD